LVGLSPSPGRMGHNVGQGCGDHKTSQIYHAGFFSHDDQHFIGHAFGQARLCKNQSENDGRKDEHDRRIHKIIKSHLGRTNQEKGLKYADGQTRDTDGHHFENPPGPGQQKNGDRPFCLPAQGKMFSHGIDGVGPGR